MRSRLLIALVLLGAGLAVGLMAARALYPVHWHAYVSFRGDAPSSDVSRWKQPFHDGVPAVHNIPFEAAMGGAKTMYPEYQQVLQTLPRPAGQGE